MKNYILAALTFVVGSRAIDLSSEILAGLSTLSDDCTQEYEGCQSKCNAVSKLDIEWHDDC